MKLFTMFAGYGTDSFALKKLGIKHELVGFSEIDKFAIQCFQQNHGGKNFGDCRQINPLELPDFDLLTAGFPCQSFSVAGKQQGELDPRGTLFYEIVRIAEAKKPKWMLLENVKGLTSKKFKSTFDKILSELDRIGYVVHWKVLNTKNFGIPQNRERVWFVCIRKDIDEPLKFQFPEPEPLNIFIKDILEPQVDEKYFLKEKQVQKLLEGIEKKQRSKRNVLQDKENVSSVLCARDYKTPKCVQFDVSGKGYNSQQDGAYNAEGVMCCLPNANPVNKVNIFALSGREGTQIPEFNKEEVSNSLTSVEKDNLVFDQRYKDKGRTYEGVVPTLNSHGDSQGGIVTPIVFNLQQRSENRPSMLKAKEQGLPLPGGSGILSKDDGTTYCVDTGNTQAVMNCVSPCFGRQGSSKEFKASCERVLNTTGMFRRLTPKECFRLQGFISYKSHKEVYGIYKEIEERCQRAREVLSTLSREIRKKEIQWEIRGFWSIQEKEILQSRMYEKEFFRKMVGRCIASTRECESKAIDEEKELRYLWKSVKPGCSSQRQEQVEQHFRELTNTMQKLSHKRTSQKGWMELLKTSEENKEQPRAIRINSEGIIFLNDEINLEGLSDTQKYKLAGNGQDVNLVSKILKNLLTEKK